ncbi:MAG: hypothetical protein GTO42_08995 [Candidatus Latescibacteria bacterium]|nr:hypothetical protein [Candidatus Latescibacterota bacterium]NIO29098.1 hypothetical protein [Candidatus Latescibacterota bacterium]NIO56723.1 hypothetical protein [Candidatus Latescibacterota bacterium]NIT02306.1 hypothetical protein [Candidatus Latescibacterota bacterium]NIT39191.1 hypothetical protein [Candidatus Latescibacterota bacterium]
MEKNFKREISALDEIFSFVDDFVTESRIDDAVAFSIRLAVEELFTNFVRHNTGGLDHIAISLKRDSNQLLIQLKDFQVEPFDMTKVKSVDVDLPLEKRKAGELGIHLVKSIVDKLSYEYSKRTLCVTAIKNLEEQDV